MLGFARQNGHIARQIVGVGRDGRRACHQATGEMGVVGASVPGLAGEGTSMSGPLGGVSLGAGVG